jgi:hypothetical protein
MKPASRLHSTLSYDAHMEIRRFPIRFDRVYAILSSALFISPSDSYVEIGPEEVVVRMAWAFRARFARSTVESTVPVDTKPLSRGVHGFAGRWLVNGSGDGILRINLSPPQRAYTLGFPVRLRELMVSVEDPRALAFAVRG